jgi:alpha-1,2-mannosyltransferase
LALVALRAWRVVAVAGATALAFHAVSLAMFGLEPWIRYFEISGPFLIFSLQDFRGFYTFMMTSVLAGARTFGLPYGTALIVQVVVAIPVLAAACWAVRRTGDPCRRAFVLAAAAPLVTPYAFNYDLTTLAAVMVWMLFGRLPWRREWTLLYVLGWLAPIVSMYGNMFGFAVGPMVLLLLFAASVHEGARSPTTPEPAERVPDRLHRSMDLHRLCAKT